jgi:hypothetical protein
MEEWQKTGCRVSKHQRVLTAVRCSVSGETMLYCRANAQQAGRGCETRMYINRRRAAMKSGIWQVHVRQHQNQHKKKQQGHQNEQARRFYRPAPHGAEV